MCIRDSTYSVGFRAPSSADLISSLLSRTVARDSPRLFSDAGRPAVQNAGELNTRDLAALKRFLTTEVDASAPDEWALAAGEAVTAGGGGSGARRGMKAGAILRRLREGARVVPAAGARLAWSRVDNGRAALFVNGESRVLARDEAFAASFLCGGASRDAGRRLAASPALLLLLADLLRAGVVALSGR